HWQDRDLSYAQVRVPMILHWPNYLSGKQKLSEIISTIDLFPTLLAQLRIAHHLGTQGSSFLDLLVAQRIRQPRYAFSELNGQSTTLFSLVRGNFHYLTNQSQTGLRSPRLYDIKSDPLEKHDVITLPRFAGARVQMADLLVQQVQTNAI